MSKFPRFYGKATIGSKGQIVIPAEVRKEMNLNPGDSVIIFSAPNDMQRSMLIVAEDEFNKLLKSLEEHLMSVREFTKKSKK